MQSAYHNKRTCTFCNQNHVYRIKATGERLTSVTTFIGQFFPKFNAKAVSEKIADERGTTPIALQREWAELGAKASREGTLTHEYAEWLTMGRGSAPLSVGSDRVHNLKKQVKRIIKKLRKSGMKFIEAEMIVFSEKLGFAGQVDLIMKNPKGVIVILDWKNIKELKKENPWEQGFGPLNVLDNCNWNKYSLQLSLYQYIIEAENYFPEANGFKRIIAHVSEDGVIPYRTRYMKTEIESMLI